MWLPVGRKNWILEPWREPGREGAVGYGRVRREAPRSYSLLLALALNRQLGMVVGRVFI